MVTDLIDVWAFSDVFPVEATISAEEKILLWVVVSQSWPNIAHSKHDAHSILRRVYWGKLAHVGVDLKVKRATVLNEAFCVPTVWFLLWCFHEFPLCTFVVSDECSNIFLYFRCWNRFFELEDFMLGFLLFFASATCVSHARLWCLLVLNRDHIVFTPLFNEIFSLLAPLSTARAIFTVLVLVNYKRSIERCDTFKVYSIAFDHIFNT